MERREIICRPRRTGKQTNAERFDRCMPSGMFTPAIYMDLFAAIVRESAPEAGEGT